METTAPLAGLLFLLVGAAAYFLPTIVAQGRKRDGVAMIFLGNLVLGWTVIGWLVLLVYAFTGESTTARTKRDEELALLREIARRDSK